VSSRLREALIHNRGLRRAVQAVRVARSVRPPLRFGFDVMRGADSGEYTSTRTGQKVVLRPRMDLQVAREHVSKDAYAPPPQAQAALARCGEMRVLDLGANIGLFTLSAMARYGIRARVLAVEPDPGNLVILRRNIAVNGYAGQVEVVPAAVGPTAGRVRFSAGLNELSRVDPAANGDSIEVEMIDAFGLTPGCTLIKMDIEGGEWPLLEDPRIEALDAQAVVMEWHRAGCTSPEPARAAEAALRRGGFEVEHRGRTDLPVGEIWAWRTTLV
jgi:FkbM family methyltransferase